MICLVEANFFLARTGAVWPLLRIDTIDPNVFHPSMFPIVMFDTLWFLFLFINFLNDFGILGMRLHEVGFRELRKHLPHGWWWYILDVIGLISGLSLAIAFGYYYRASYLLGKRVEDEFGGTLSNDVDSLHTF